MNSTATILAGGTLRAKTAPTLARNARTIRESRKGAAMIEFTRILCPIDFSETSARALTYATALARWYDAHLEPSVFDPCHPAATESRRRRQELMDHARRRLHALIAQEPTTWCEIEEVVAVDRAYEAILRHAEETTADLIVMGAQGTGGLELMLYGSNTHHVVRAAPCPVLTVRA